MAYNIVYKGHCDYIGNYWHMGECIRAWFYYDEEKEEYWVKAECGNKFANRKGMIVHLNYQRWEDVLEDWVVPHSIQVEGWYGTEANKILAGNCFLEEFCHAQLIVIGTNMAGLQIRGYKNNVPDEAFVEVK